MGSDLKAFGQRLRSRRNELNISQEELGEKVGTSKSVISGYENGQNDPRQSMVVKLSKALGVSINWLITGNDTIKVDFDRNNKLSPELRELIIIFNQLSLDTQKNILQYANYLLSQEKKHTFSEPDILPYVASSNLFDDESNDKELSERVENWKNENN